MLKKITLKNFKPFGDTKEANAPLAPITLVYGPNSAGKSSFIQALLVLKQTITERTSRGSSDLITKGSLVDVGNFSSAVHRHDQKRSIEFGLTFSTSLLDQSPYRFPNTNRSGEFGLSISISAQQQATGLIGPTLSSVNYRLEHDKQLFEFGFDRKESRPDTGTGFVDEFQDEDFEVGPEIFVLSAKTNRDKLATLIASAAEHGSIRRGPNRNGGPENLKLSAEEVRRFLSDCCVTRREMGSNGADYLPTDAGTLMQTGSDANRPIRLGFTDINRMFGFALQRTFRNMGYLGPLRSYPARHYMLDGSAGRSVGTAGEFTIPILYQNQLSNSAEVGDLIGAVNYWFSKFEIPYELNIENIGSPITGDFIVLTLNDKRTNVLVGPADVGFGIGQLLPILVEGMLGEAFSTGWRLLCVEQPEIHLHPRLQADLADFFIDTAKLTRSSASGQQSSSPRRRGGAQWIIETHSEALVLRLQRRIREGKIRAEDVSVLYVQSNEDVGATIEQLRLDESGEFIDQWPDGFFEESYREMMGGR